MRYSLGLGLSIIRPILGSGNDLLAAPENLYTETQATFADVTRVDFRDDWGVSNGALLMTGPGSDDVRIGFSAGVTVPIGEPAMMTWRTAGVGTQGVYRPQFGGAGSSAGGTIPLDETRPHFYFLTAAEATGAFNRTGFNPTTVPMDEEFTDIAVYPLGTTDPTQVACDVILVVGDSLLANASSDFATQDNTSDLPFDGRLWYIPSLLDSPNQFNNTQSVRHIPQPVFEPIQNAGGAARITPLHAMGLDLVSYSAARGRPVLIAAMADAGTGLNGNNGQQWRHPDDIDTSNGVPPNGSANYNDMVAMKAAIEALGPTHEIIGAVVSLGSNDTTGADYATVWEPVAVQFVTRLRALWGANLPIAWLGSNPDWEAGQPPNYDNLAGLPRWIERMRTAQANLDQDSGSPNAISGVRYVAAAAGQTYQGAGQHIPDSEGKTDDPHFTAEGQKLNGRALAAGLLALINAGQNTFLSIADDTVINDDSQIMDGA